jgi:hypothetical protein
MSNLHDASSIEDMLERLRVMAENDPNYRTLYKRVTKRSFDEEGVDLSRVDTTHGLQLISALWKTFKKQNPEVKNVFILENGDVVVGDASLSNAANQLRSEYINNIVTYAKGNKGFFTYDDKKKVFVGNQAKIKEFFPVAGYEFNLDPTFEPEIKGRDEGMPLPIEEHIEIFSILQKYNRLN